MKLQKYALYFLFFAVCTTWLSCGSADVTPSQQSKATLGKNLTLRSCVPIQEICNGKDDDCDGLIDNNIIKTPCHNDCGIGFILCREGAWTRCTAGQNITEICNGLDDNCDGQIDEDVVRACKSKCGTGQEVCSDGDWNSCDAQIPVEEICNKKDDDCDGWVDEGLEDKVEECNGKDENCDGCIDEGAVCGRYTRCVAGACRPRCLAGACPSGFQCYDGFVCFPIRSCYKSKCPLGMVCNNTKRQCQPTATESNVCPRRQ